MSNKLLEIAPNKTI